MDFNYSQEERPYKGVALVCSIMLFIPLITYLISRGVLRAERFLDRMQFYEALFFGGAVGTVFTLSFILCGGFRKAFLAVRKRVRDFFQDLAVSFSFAREGYRDNVKEYGIAFWLYMMCFLLNVAMLVWGGVGFVRMYSQMI